MSPKARNTFTSKNEHETKQKAEVLTKKLQRGQIVFLQGDLGAGKTTFVKGVARELGVTTRILSPTFTLLRTHEVKNEKYVKKGITKLYHLDLYRLPRNESSIQETLIELQEKKDGLIFIEWPEKVKIKYKKKPIIIKIQQAINTSRKIISEDKLL